MNIKTQCIEDVASSAFLDVIFAYNECARALTGCGRVVNTNAILRRHHLRCISGCDIILKFRGAFQAPIVFMVSYRAIMAWVHQIL